MDIRTSRETIVTVIFSEREAKLLACLIGSMSPNEVEEIIKRAIHFDEWIGRLEKKEAIEYTGILYDTLYGLFEYGP